MINIAEYLCSESRNLNFWPSLTCLWDVQVKLAQSFLIQFLIVWSTQGGGMIWIIMIMRYLASWKWNRFLQISLFSRLISTDSHLWWNYTSRIYYCFAYKLARWRLRTIYDAPENVQLRLLILYLWSITAYVVTLIIHISSISTLTR